MRNVIVSAFLLLTSFVSHAAVGVLTVYDNVGSGLHVDSAVTASVNYPGAGSSISSPTLFLGVPWTAHDITTYQNGTYTINTSEGNTYTFTVAANQIGVHMLLDWNAVTNISVVQVWDVSAPGGVTTYTSTDWDADGVPGGAMIDGPFPGFSFATDLSGNDLPNVVNGPSITMNGNATVNLKTGDIYIDAGATATDTEDGDLTGSIVITNPVDTSTAGIYTVEYSVTDSDANTTIATRTVIVTEGEFPVINLNGLATETVYAMTAYVDPGAVASDFEDGSLTSSIVVTGSVDTSIAGSYMLTYSVTDTAGNTSSVVRTVEVILGDAPVISLLGSSSMTLSLGEFFLDPGATASDTEDGDLTSFILVSGSVNTFLAGTYTINYSVHDSQGNHSGTVTRTISVVDPFMVGGVLQVFDQTGVTAHYDDQVTASISYPGTGSTIATPTLFFALPFTFHTITTYEMGTHTVATTLGNSYTFAVAEDQIGVHMLIDWGVNVGIDVVMVWDVTYPGGVTTYTSSDWDGDGIPGGAMIEGPFPGITLSIDLLGNALPPVNNVPQISIIGDSTVNLQTSDSYTDAGATANDAEDGDLTASIVTVSTVDTSTAGTYTVEYSVTDSDGNTSTATRTVIVTHGAFPVITLNGSSTDTALIFNSYIDPGATATDVEDGSITANIAVSGAVDTSVVGSYNLIYSITDSDGNTTTATRIVNVITGDIPVISLTGNSVVSIPVGTAYLDAGATASDTEDGDVTSAIVVSGSVDSATAGSYTISYNVTDSNGNAAIEVTRTVEVFDPSIVGGVLQVYENTGASMFYDAAVTASISYPGTGSVISTPTWFLGIPFVFHDVVTYGNGTHTVSTSQGGSYTFTVAANQIGAHMLIDWNASLNIDVVMVWDVSSATGVTTYTSSDWDGDGIPGGAMIEGPFPGFTLSLDLIGDALPAVVNLPEITVLGSTDVNIMAGSNYIDEGATAFDAEDGDLTGSIIVSNPVDTSMAGTYTVEYSVTDSDGNTVISTRTVTVVQGEFPVITLNGISPALVLIDGVYVEEGAIASDAEDGDISSSIVITSDLNVSALGSYTVTYTVTDSDANTSFITRTVNVITGDIPVITLLGDSEVTLQVGESYIDAGATASDTEDGDISSSVVVNNNVNTATPGTYSVTYNVVDSNGNSALQVSRQVNVLVSIGNAEMCIYSSSGSIVGCDPTVVADIVYPGAGSTMSSPTPFFGELWTTHSLVTYLEGSYSVDTVEGGVYNFTVGPGQIGIHMLLDWCISTNIDILLVWDVTSEADGSLTLTSTDWDNDGIPGGVMIDGPFIGVSASFDIQGVSEHVGDNTPPEIFIDGSASEIIYADSVYYDQGATAFDAEDGELTAEIIVSGYVDTSTPGTYTIVYSVTDYSGYEVSANRTVKVVIADADADGIFYLNDNCTEVANADQRDTDADGYGNMCDADLNNDNMINAVDLGMFRQRYFSSDADADLNGDGIVNAIDLGMFKQMFGSLPGPSGL